MRTAPGDNVIVSRLLSWYELNKRPMPWREVNDPYKIWLSEIILQQTRIEQGLPYYLKFVEKYPTIKHLSEAHIDEVLRLWQGLGYYSRARNLHKCAKTVNRDFGGHFPPDRKALMKLPGIGPYTSAAIASFAFGRREAVVDGNVMRVITRLYGTMDDIASQKTIKKISETANKLIPFDHPGIFNQAIMEFGAICCMPANPNCSQCIFNDFCVARAKGWQKRIPVKSKAIKKRTRYFNYLIIEMDGRLLMKKRNQNDIWKGLFEFYLLETTQENAYDQLQLPEQLVSNSRLWTLATESELFKHLLTHQIIMCRFYHIKFVNKYKFDASQWTDYQQYTLSEIDDLPKPVLIDKYLGEKII
jgi:A/G-specific adenine glycosylase